MAHVHPTVTRPLAPRDEVDSLLRRMPKAELHVHLDGSVRPATAFALARERGLDDGFVLVYDGNPPREKFDDDDDKDKGSKPEKNLSDGTN
ncbi:MAG: hypothetical protein ACLQBX_02925 [Candidatus Limnocylindrales bacterium]